MTADKRYGHAPKDIEYSTLVLARCASAFQARNKPVQVTVEEAVSRIAEHMPTSSIEMGIIMSSCAKLATGHNNQLL